MAEVLRCPLVLVYRLTASAWPHHAVVKNRGGLLAVSRPGSLNFYCIRSSDGAGIDAASAWRVRALGDRDEISLPTNAGVGGLFREEDVAIALDHAGDWHERQFELAEILHEREITHHAKNDTLALRVAVGGHK